MQPQLRIVRAFVVTLAVIQAANAQCRLPGGVQGHGAIDGGHALVAGYGPSFFRYVTFFEKTGEGWQEGQSHVIGNVQVVYPLALAIDGDRAIAGSPESDSLTGEFLAGRAVLFDRVGGQWVSTELLSATSGAEDLFGYVVDVSGDVAVVGASHETLGYGDRLPRAHVFEFDGTSWNEVAQLRGGMSDIDIEGDIIVIGDESDFPGRVRVYERVAGVWTWTAGIEVATTDEGPYFGSSVALQGDTLAVGAAWPFMSSSAHYVKVFRRQAAGIWNEVQHIVPSDSSPGDQFGRGIALSGSTLLVGAPGVGSGLAGVVYRFEHDGTSFVETGRIVSDVPVQGFGYDVAFQGEDAVLSTWSTGSFYRLGFAQKSSFCPTTPNSTGAHGLLTVEGCDSLDGQRLTLHASNLPPGVLGRVFFGANTAQAPFGDGFRCVGAPLYRLPAEATDASGHLVHDVDFSSDAASHITAGQTWHFQVYHRDSASTGAQPNLTNALSVGITP